MCCYPKGLLLQATELQLPGPDLFFLHLVDGLLDLLDRLLVEQEVVLQTPEFRLQVGQVHLFGDVEHKSQDN